MWNDLGIQRVIAAGIQRAYQRNIIGQIWHFQQLPSYSPTHMVFLPRFVTWIGSVLGMPTVKSPGVTVKADLYLRQRINQQGDHLVIHQAVALAIIINKGDFKRIGSRLGGYIGHQLLGGS